MGISGVIVVATTASIINQLFSGTTKLKPVVTISPTSGLEPMAVNTKETTISNTNTFVKFSSTLYLPIHTRTSPNTTMITVHTVSEIFGTK